MPPAAVLLGPLRDAPWLGPDRARAWSRVLLAVSLAAALAWAGLSHGGLDLAGHPLGTDFVSFWSAGRLAARGAPAEAWRAAAHAAVEHSAVAGAWRGYTPFPYPPSFLLVCLPFGVLPYLPALVAWIAATGVAFAASLRRWLPPGAAPLVAAAAYPAVLINAANGQNGFLTAALFGAGALFWGRRPFLSGLLLGLLAFKPHLGLLLPVAMLAARQWRAIAGAAISAAALTLASAAAFGLEAWQAFLPTLAVQRAVVEQGVLEPGKVISLFSALRLWGAPLTLAYAAQALLAAAVALAVARQAWRRPTERGTAALLVCAAALAPPYLLDYDLTLAAFPMAWLLAEGIKDGFRPWEKIALASAYLLPLVCRPAALGLGLPLAPLVLGALFLVVLRRANGQGSEAQSFLR
jgi:hypothetical protein